MKNIKLIYLLSLLFIGTTLLSCNEDDQVFIDGDPTELDNQVALQASLTLDAAGAPENSGVGFTATIPQTFDTDVYVTVTAEANNGNRSTATDTIFAGQTSNQGGLLLTPPADDTDIVGLVEPDAVSVQVTAIRLEQPVANTQYNISSNVETLNLLTLLGFRAILDWSIDAADIDYALFTAAGGGAFANNDAQTGAKPEQLDYSNADLPDGDYLILFNIFSNGLPAGDTTSTCTFTTTFIDTEGGSTSVVEFTDTDYATTPSGFFLDTVAVAFTKTTTDGATSYTITGPN